jgi:hypothetical protein
MSVNNEITTQDTIQVVTYGYVPTSVIDLIKEGITDALRTMNFAGNLPVAHISEGPIIKDDGGEIYAGYSHQDCAVQLWWSGIGQYVTAVPENMRQNVGVYFCAAHEAVHHVQWQRGYGKPTIDDGTAAYQNHPLEIEANAIANALIVHRFWAAFLK